jgi:hypothetical protein
MGVMRDMTALSKNSDMFGWCHEQAATRMRDQFDHHKENAMHTTQV